MMLVLLLPGVAMSQDNPSNDSFKEQYVRLYHEYVKNPSSVSTLVDLAAFYAASGNPLQNFPQAATYIRQAEEVYVAKLRDDNSHREMQKLVNKGYTLQSIRQQKRDIETQAMAYLRQHQATLGSEELAAFSTAFSSNSSIVREVNAGKLRVDYEQTLSENTLAGYYTFCQNHPGTPEADTAERALAVLAQRYFALYDDASLVDAAAAPYSASATVRQAAMQRKSSLAFAAACRANTPEAYADYLEKYPRGADYLAALERSRQLHGIEFSTLSTPEELARFIDTYNDDPLADSAMVRLRNMIVNDHSQRAAHIYFSRYQLDDEYIKIFRDYYGWYVEEGNHAPLAIFAQKHPDFPDQHTLKADLKRSAAFDSIDLTQRYTEADYGRVSDAVRRTMGKGLSFVALQRLLQQQIARKEWAAAKSRMKSFELCFEESYTDKYNELGNLLDGAGAVASHLELLTDSLERAVSNPNNHFLYYSHTHRGRHVISYVYHTKKNWQYVGDVRFVDSVTLTVPVVVDTTDTLAASDSVQQFMLLRTTQPLTPQPSAQLFCFYRNYALVGIDGDVWLAEMVSDSLWMLRRHYSAPLNTSYIETDAFLLEDGSGILFASDRPDGLNVQPSGSYFHGDTALATDLYYLALDATGNPVGEPVNLGLQVNSPYCELSPLLSRNLRTLYFVTDARGLGYGDVYKTTRTDISDWSHWSTPVSLGRVVNSPFEESALSFANGEKNVFYLSANASGRRACYSFATQHDTTQAARSVKIDVSDALPLYRLMVVDMQNQRVVSNMMSDAIDSVQSVSLLQGQPYAVLAMGYRKYVPTQMVVPEKNRLVSLHGYDAGQPLPQQPLPLVRFSGNSSRLLPMAEKELECLAMYLKQRPEVQIELVVNVKGDNEAQCYDLSLQRALAIRTFLVGTEGIDAGRIHLSAFGNIHFKDGTATSEVAVVFR